jgi:hypothetical protein
MLERATITAENDVGHHDAASVRALEERVRRLEDAVATVQDTRHLEERVAEKVAERLGSAANSGQESAGFLVDAGRRMLPATVEMLGSQLMAVELKPRASAGNSHPSWLLFDAWAEAQTILRMFLDRRYRLSWAARFVLPAALGCMLISWLFFSSIWIIGPIVDKVMDLALAFVAYKVLSREAQRYREMT